MRTTRNENSPSMHVTLSEPLVVHTRHDRIDFVYSVMLPAGFDSVVDDSCCIAGMRKGQMIYGAQPGCITLDDLRTLVRQVQSS